MEFYVPGEICRLLGPNEWLPQFNGHALDRLRPPPGAEVSIVTGDTGDGLLLDIAANAHDTDTIYTLEVVTEIELVEVKRDAELGVARGEKGGSDEGDCEFRSFR